MSDHIYEVGFTKTTGASAGFIADIVPGTLGSGIRIPQIREIGIFAQTAVAAVVGLGWASSAPTGTATGATVQANFSGIDPAGHTVVNTAYGTTNPGAPSVYSRRFDTQGVPGAGVVFTWGEGELPLWSGASVPHFLIYQISALAVTFDGYVKVAE